MATPEQLLIRNNVDLTDAQIERFISMLDRFLSINLRKVLRELPTGRDRALNAASILSSIRDQLNRAGLSSEIAKIDEIYGAQLKSVKDAFDSVKKPGEFYTETDMKVIEQIIKFDEAIIANKVYQVTDSLSASLMRQVITGQRIDIDVALEGVSKTTAAQINTELRTATSGLYQSVTQAKAKELNIDLFAYVGPDDGITRPFCKPRVNKIFTRSQIAKWDNGTDLPASIYRGGYNCRHIFLPITKEKAESRVSEGMYQWG